MVSALDVPHRAQFAHLQGLDVVSVLEFAAIDCGVVGQRAALIYEAGLVLCLILLCVLVALQQIGQMSQHAARCSCLFQMLASAHDMDLQTRQDCWSAVHCQRKRSNAGRQVSKAAAS